MYKDRSVTCPDASHLSMGYQTCHALPSVNRIEQEALLLGSEHQGFIAGIARGSITWPKKRIVKVNHRTNVAGVCNVEHLRSTRHEDRHLAIRLFPPTLWHDPNHAHV